MDDTINQIVTLSKAGIDEAGRKVPNLQGRRTIQGMNMAIENKAGTHRHWYDPHNKTKGKTKMICDYGYIQKTMGMDGDKVDVYIGPNPEASSVYIVHQMKAPEFKEFDEDKCMIGFDSVEGAATAYQKHYNNKKFLGSITEMPIDKFKAKVFNTSKKPQMIKALTEKKAAPKANGETEEIEEPSSKLDQAAIAKVHGERKLRPGSGALSKFTRDDMRRTLSPADYTRPQYEDEQ